MLCAFMEPTGSIFFKCFKVILEVTFTCQAEVPNRKNYILLYFRTGDLFLRLFLAPEIFQDNCPLENTELAECELFMRKHQFKQPSAANQTVFLPGHRLPWVLHL